MSHLRTEYQSTEGILLLRREGVTMAVHLTAVVAILEAFVFEPDIPSSEVYAIPPSYLDHYGVEVTGRSDRIYMWTGPDPFAKSEIEASRAEVEA